MCGRFILRTFPDSWRQQLQLPEEFSETRLFPRFNIAPSQHVAVAKTIGDTFAVVPMRWGLIPKWMKEAPSRGGFINARSETVYDKPSFRSAVKYNRCLVLADGFYEWQKTANRKQPFLFERPDSSLFCFAGIYDEWQGPNAEPQQGVSILTTSPNATTEPIHDRSPVVIHEGDYETWVQTEPDDAKSLTRLLRPAPDDFWTTRPVPKAVNSPRWDKPELIERSDVGGKLSVDPRMR